MSSNLRSMTRILSRIISSILTANLQRSEAWSDLFAFVPNEILKSHTLGQIDSMGYCRRAEKPMVAMNQKPIAGRRKLTLVGAKRLSGFMARASLHWMHHVAT